MKYVGGGSGTGYMERLVGRGGYDARLTSQEGEQTITVYIRRGMVSKVVVISTTTTTTTITMWWEAVVLSLLLLPSPHIATRKEKKKRKKTGVCSREEN